MNYSTFWELGCGKIARIGKEMMQGNENIKRINKNYENIHVCVTSTPHTTSDG